MQIYVVICKSLIAYVILGYNKKCKETLNYGK